MADPAARPVHVTVVYSPGPRTVHEWPLALPEGATVLDALEGSGLAVAWLGFDARDALIGVWGRMVRPGRRLRERDRIEVYRPLRVDPKVARRERFRSQGARAAGLFARKRQGAKPGY